MTESFARLVLERKSVAFVLGLASLVGLAAFHRIDASAFSVSFVALMSSFMAAVAYQEKPSA